MSVIKKVLLTLVMMLVWGLGKEVAQKLQGSNYGFLTLIVSIVCVTIILDIWSGFFLFSKKIEADDNVKKNEPVSQSYLNTINNVSHSISEKNEHKKTLIKNTIIPMSNQKEQKEKTVQINSQNFSASEEAIYNIISLELESGDINKALWTKLFAQFEGNEVKIKSEYIRQRFERICNEKNFLKEEERKANSLHELANASLKDKTTNVSQNDNKKNKRSGINGLIDEFNINPTLATSVDIAKMRGYELVSSPDTSYGDRTIRIKSPHNQVFKFEDEGKFVSWVKHNLC
ncbi:MAG: hypothetical protein Q7J24_15075 [Desulfomicrobium sp.]|nr:hypothetical protein [Desulfomicrobium sp.]